MFITMKKRMTQLLTKMSDLLGSSVRITVFIIVALTLTVQQTKAQVKRTGTTAKKSTATARKKVAPSKQTTVTPQVTAERMYGSRGWLCVV